MLQELNVVKSFKKLWCGEEREMCFTRRLWTHRGLELDRALYILSYDVIMTSSMWYDVSM